MRLVAMIACALWSPAAHADGCPTAGAVVIVETARHEIVLCDGGVATARFAVSLGSGGLGKLKEGDRKTPLGSYPLALPQASSRFGRFIPIGFPTLEQSRRGLTGSDLGIHGPPRGIRALGGLAVRLFPALAAGALALDWTEGCVAVGDDATMDEVAVWVRAKRPARIELR